MTAADLVGRFRGVLDARIGWRFDTCMMSWLIDARVLSFCLSQLRSRPSETPASLRKNSKNGSGPLSQRVSRNRFVRASITPGCEKSAVMVLPKRGLLSGTFGN